MALPFLTGKPKTSATDFTDSHGLVFKIRENPCEFVAKTFSRSAIPSKAGEPEK